MAVTRTAPDGVTPDDTADRFARVSRNDPSHPASKLWGVVDGPYRPRFVLWPSNRACLTGAALLLAVAAVLLVLP